jgi:uncharacterized protein YcbX
MHLVRLRGAQRPARNSGAFKGGPQGTAKRRGVGREPKATETSGLEGDARASITQGDGLPITGRRLTALMHHIRVRADKLKSPGAATAPVKTRPNPVNKLGPGAKKTVSLSPEMNRREAGNSPDKTISEDEIRRAELSKHAHLLGKR